ncbi:hypothetical protein [Aurantimonas coralicida]|uniref:hypothetical protein n=1 Tax=Aurantimonas coralicida TaxID=182270 RepID=UPI001E51040B|nr:hypothetical protein [Aurantimonas coralicida]MCD1644171.1 hypothetical protein [Aurantimonas coralicida]
MDDRAFFDAVRAKPFGGSISASAVDGINAILPAFQKYGDGDVRKLAYILGTAFHESARFKTMEEYASGRAYEGRKDLGNTVNGDGVRFKGRGFVQLTGRANYQDWSRRLGMDLIKEPQIVTRRDIAARILVQGMMLGTFTGKGLPDYIGTTRADYRSARRVVNGMDRSHLIAGYAEAFEAALRAAGYGKAPHVPKPTPAPTPTKPKNTVERPPVSQPKRGLPWIGIAIGLLVVGGAAAAIILGA